MGIRLVRERFPPQRRTPQDGDWICDACQNINYKWRYVCNAYFCKGEWTEHCRAYVAGRGYMRPTDPLVSTHASPTSHANIPSPTMAPDDVCESPTPEQIDVCANQNSQSQVLSPVTSLAAPPKKGDWLCPVCSCLNPHGVDHCLVRPCVGKWHATVLQYVGGEGFADLTKPRLPPSILVPRIPLEPLQPADQSTRMPLIYPGFHGVPRQQTGFDPSRREPLSSNQRVVETTMPSSHSSGLPARTVPLQSPVSRARLVPLKQCKPPPPTARHGSVPKMAAGCAASSQTIEQSTTAPRSSFVPFPPRMMHTSTQTDPM